MPGEGAANNGPDGAPSMLAQLIATVCLIWYLAVVVVCIVGYVQLQRHYSSPPPPSSSSAAAADSDDLPCVTIIRPVKGLEPYLYECLAATFRQTYPREKLTIYFCVSDREDPAVPVLERLMGDFPGFDSKVLVEEEDPLLQQGDGETSRLGPNPKIRNMSRAYREAKGDIVWIIDCNVWIGKGVAGRMVDTLTGRGGKRKNKFVHQLPVVVDTASQALDSSDTRGLLDPAANDNEDIHVASTSTAAFDLVRRSSQSAKPSSSLLQRLWTTGGGRLEETFMASSHAKFYTAINTVLVAPCIVGKSNMFRRSHLDALTRGAGIDHFSENICEDHLIGDLLWKAPVPAEVLATESHLHGHDGRGEEKERESWGNHALVFGDLAIQPMARMSVGEYVARRVRWLRVRKFTVTLATLVEPGTESLACSACGAFAVATLPWFEAALGVPRTWAAAACFWMLSVGVWAAMDWRLYRMLLSGASVEPDEETPVFARRMGEGEGKGTGKGARRRFGEWLLAWLGREVLAFPVWFWAVLGGVTVTWRGKRFWVGMDMRVHRIGGDGEGRETVERVNGSVAGRGKARRD